MTHTQVPSPSPRTATSGGFRSARTLFSVRGVPVRAEGSLLLIAGFLVYLFYGRLQASLGDLPAVVVLLSALAATLLFFASVLAHEIGHAVTSLDRGIGVRSITLFALGGVTESVREADRARDEFVIVGIGPFVSLVLAAAFGILATVLDGVRPLDAIAGYLGWTNLALAIFNIVPGYPLDGGRLLRSLLWGITGRPHRATRWAARVGQAFAGLLIAAGAWLFLRQATGGLDGVWEVIIGLFLLRGATESHRRARVRERLGQRTARDVMGNVPPTLAGDLTLAEAVEQLQQRPSLLWPVGRPLVGGLRLDQIDAVPANEWVRTTVGSIAEPAERVSVDGGMAMDLALDRLAAAPGNMLLVVDDGHAVGLLTPSLVTGLIG
ncbi:MAG: site-2 protease family protein [Euzebyales bacterium]|nr:site-2 protease family protein [Euzebyales bacterium]